MTLPQQYLDYIASGGDTEFEIDAEFGSYIILEPLDDIEQFNQDIEINKYAPGFIAFASDGGGEAFAFNEQAAIFLIPLIGMSPEAATKISESWTEYESKKINTE